LPATLWALEHGVTLALANKESLVAAGELALAAQEQGGGLLLPVDSEHSAAFQCLQGRTPDQVHSLVLTGSGGPFRGRRREELEPPHLETFPLLPLAREAGERGGTYPCAFNAANEVAVAAFLTGKLPFLGIAETMTETLAYVDGAPARDLEHLVEVDREARRL